MQLLGELFAGRRLVLASRSPRRRLLLQQMGLMFDIQASEIDESLRDGEAPVDYVRRLAREKALTIAQHDSDAWVIGADTIVVLGERILGKPADPAEAIEMLKALSGRQHQVFTGFSLVNVARNAALTDHVCTEVRFRKLEEQEIIAYVRTGSPLDKAGSYGIQDGSALFVDSIDGCFYNVVGFPLARFYEKCRSFLQMEDSSREA